MKITITKHHTLPQSSILLKNGTTFNYIDSFQGQVLNRKPDISEVLHVFLTSGPRWVDFLMSVRDKIVGVFGLKTSEGAAKNPEPLNDIRFVPGEQLGLFKLFNKSDNEIILGEDDKHLNFRVSLLLEPFSPDTWKISVTTAVHYNNIMGRIYFLPVKPIHQLLVRSTVKEMLIKLESNGFN